MRISTPNNAIKGKIMQRLSPLYVAIREAKYSCGWEARRFEHLIFSGLPLQYKGGFRMFTWRRWRLWRRILAAGRRPSTPSCRLPAPGDASWTPSEARVQLLAAQAGETRWMWRWLRLAAAGRCKTMLWKLYPSRQGLVNWLLIILTLLMRQLRLMRLCCVEREA